MLFLCINKSKTRQKIIVMNKTIKLSLLSAVVVTAFGINEASAQATGNTTLTVQLDQVRSITVADATVNITFNSAADYINGKSTTKNNHLVVTSTADYEVKVKSGGDLINGSNSIPIGTISLTPTAGSTGTAPDNLLPITNLSNTDQTIASSATGTVQTSINVQYAASGGTNYVNVPSGNYTATITYSIEAL